MDQPAEVPVSNKLPPEDGEQLSGLAWMRMVLKIAPVGVFRADSIGYCIYVNERWCELTGLRAAEAFGTGWMKAIHPEDRSRVVEEWQRMTKSGTPFHCEYRYWRPDGSACWVLGQVSEQRDELGSLLSYVGTATDITELRAMREELRHSHDELELRVRERTTELERMAMIVEASDDAIITSALDGSILGWNRAAETMYGYRAEETLGLYIWSLVPEHLVEEARMLKERVHNGESVLQHETTRVAKSGEVLDVSLSAFPLRDASGVIVGSSVIVRDITAAKRARLRLRQLSWKLLSAQDDERRRIARELHDSTAQTIAGLAMTLAVLDERDGTRLTPARRHELIAESRELADSATRELRTLSYLLHPPLLDEMGLTAALRWFVEGFVKRSGIQVSLKIAPDIERLSSPLETALFRVVQESLVNVHRHSQSPTAAIRLAHDEGWIELEIRDHGRGLPPKVEDQLGVGISGMKERLLQLGGSLTIESNANGTVVLARIPDSA